MLRDTSIGTDISLPVAAEAGGQSEREDGVSSQRIQVSSAAQFHRTLAYAISECPDAVDGD